MRHRTLLVLCCFTLLFSAGCGPRVPQNPLAGVGGTRLVYKPQDARPVEPDKIAGALRTILKTEKTSVYARLQDDGNCEILLPGASEQRVAEVKKAIAASNRLQFRIVADEAFDKKLIADARDGQQSVGGSWVPFDPKKVVLSPGAAVNVSSEGISRALIVEGEQPVDAWHFSSAEMSRDQQSRPGVRGVLNREGAIRMKRLTSDNLRRQLAIVVDGKIASAPVIQATISSQLEITGDFATDELEGLVITLRTAHALASLEPEPSAETSVPPDQK